MAHKPGTGPNPQGAPLRKKKKRGLIYSALVISCSAYLTVAILDDYAQDGKPQPTIATAPRPVPGPGCSGGVTLIAPPHGIVFKKDEPPKVVEERLTPWILIPPGCSITVGHNGPKSIIDGSGRIYTQEEADRDRDLFYKLEKVRFASEHSRAVTLNIFYFKRGPG